MTKLLSELSTTERKEMRRRLSVHLDARSKAEVHVVEARKSAAMELARSTAKRLKDEFGATRVAVFGSLATDQFGPFSDVDLVAWGIPAGRHSEAYCALAGDRDGGSLGPDIVFAEAASPALLECVRAANVAL